MRIAFLLSALLTLTQIVLGQKIQLNIDHLNSNSEVEKLIRSFDKDYQQFSLKSITAFKSDYNEEGFCKRIADSLGITKSFYKADFDHNGYTDLLAIGDYYGFKIFIVMNYGNDSLKLKRLTRRSFQECTFPKIISDTIIRYYFLPQPSWREKEESTSLQSIDLIFKYGDFIEYNSHPRNYSIEKIEYQTSTCFGTCPKFNIVIDPDKSSIFKAEAYNRNNTNGKAIAGIFKTVLSDSSFSEIISLLNYIDFPNLKDNYAVNWTDDQTSTLTVTFNSGQVKTIKDYGLIGTYGLDRLYELIFKLRLNENWK